ncbi:signal peptidase I [Candidatus Gottesmanbacteria bacterium RIFCSPHIGHO2_02_FULL_40_13]|uniref:Signal peptidase I n=1 Tax=Candidatus Gottesmanbacteria bacterium RIFCSPHIGHO2_02_FULL_40_13 TaxID=1798384 RepID=A0A1F6AD75_9BACT|nr:MAG: signal peptidase I [Candidatus Gottesmanbacteria bacterium RIFCSPHIGHO2_02_FULL_40_13]
MDFMETIVVALSIFVVVYLFLVQPHEVKGSSMEVSFHNNEYILTDKISYRFINPDRGDVIIFKAPNNPEVDYIKRVIGLPEDKVKVEKGYVYVNDQKLTENYLREKTYLYPGSFMGEGVNITVPKDHLFVMGDNRAHSSDSREFGPVLRDSIIGKAFLRYWPLSEFGLVPQIKY